MRNLLSSTAILLGILSFVGGSSAAFAANADSGRSVYATSCASCHAVPSSPWGVSALTIQNAIQSNRGGMGRLSTLSTAELQDIAAYLANPTATTATTVATTGSAPPATTPSPVTTTTITDSDRVFDWAESTYPQQFGSRSPSQNVNGYYLRYYPDSNVYLATQNGQLYFYNASRPEEGALRLGALSDWLTQLTPTTASQRQPNGDDNGTEGNERENHNDHGHDGHKGNDD